MGNSIMPSIIRATTTSGLQVAPDNSGSLQLQTNGTTTAVTIDTSQNVGIGTTSPTAKLDVSGQIRTTSAASESFYRAVNTSGSLYLGVDSSTGATFGAGNYSRVIYSSAAYPLVMFTNDIERMRIDSSGYVTNAVNGLGNGIVQAQQYYRLNSVRVGANATGAQSIFGVGVTLIGSTQYEFEAVYMLSRSAGTTAHTMAFGFGGTATINNIGYTYAGGINGAASSGPASVATLGYTNTATLTTATSGAASAPGFSTVIIKGTVSVNAGGTFIPQYSLSAAPGGAYTTQIGSYFKIAPLAASGANVSIGSWA